MSALLTPTTAGILMIANGFVPGFLVYWLRNEPQGIVVRWFRFAMLCGMVWSVSFGLIALVESSALRLAITNVFIVAVPAASIATFAYAYEFTFREPLPGKYLLLFTPVVLLFVVSWFNPYQLVYTVENPYTTSEILVPADPGSIRLVLNMIGAPILFLMAAGLVGGELLRADYRPRQIQSGLILLIIFAGFIPGMMKVFELVPPYFDPTPLGWSVMALVFGVTIKRSDLFRLSPSPKRRVFDKLADPVIVLNPESVVSDANRAARETFRIDLGMTVTELRAANPALDAVFDSTETRVKIDDNDSRQVLECTEISLELGYGTRGEILLFRDITEQTITADALEEKNDRLEAFASRLSHDLQGPVTVAEGYLNIARRADDPTDALDEIETALHRADSLIEDILTLARSGNEPDREAVRISRHARQAWEAESTKDASLVIDTDGTIDADPQQLIRLFENVFRNSVEHGSTSSRPQADDAIEHGGSDVTVRVGTTADGFYVADDGAGIPPEDRERVFADGVTTAPGGVGHGLAIVQDIVDAHDWAVAITDSESGGARIEITGLDIVSEESTAA